MKAESTGRTTEKGFSTLEILVSFAVIILCIGAVIMVVFGGQSIAVDTQTNNEAVTKAQALLEKARADSRSDFSSVNPVLPDPSAFYKESLDVLDLAQCQKRAISKVSWKSDARTQAVLFSTFLSDITGALALGGDCDSSPLGEWDNPTTATSLGLGGQGATDIDARNNFIYLTSDPSAAPKEDFIIYEFDPVATSLAERGKINVSAGLNAVDAIDDYAFTANTETSNQLMVFDVSDPLNPTPFAPVSLPNTITGIARSIFFYNDFIYIGTQYQPCVACLPHQNNEFHIYDVSTPGVPVWKGSYKVNHNIDDIIVRDNYAYLATSDNNGEIYIYDISNPANILFKSKFDTPGNEDGKSLYLLGNKLYLGRVRTPAARKDFYILNIENPNSITELGSLNLGLNPGAIVIGVVVKGSLAFVGLDNPTSGLKILNISDPSNITDHPICTSLNFSENSTAIDMDGDFIFSANRSNDEIRVIRDQTSTCS